MSKLHVSDESYAVGKGHANIVEEKLESNGSTWLQGEVHTPRGIVSVYSQGDDTFRPSTQLKMIVLGRCHTRRMNRRFTARGLITKAKAFASEFETDAILMNPS